MSRAYRIRVSESVARVIHVEDGVATQLELLPLLPEERFASFLAEELERRGFTIADGIAKRSEEGGIVVEVELESGTVKVTVASQAEVALTAERSGPVDDRSSPESIDKAKEQLARRAQAQLERDVSRAEERLQQDATRRLEEKLRDLKQELDGIVNRTTGAALKERAAQLGEIEEIVEEESGAVTIKVKV